MRTIAFLFCSILFIFNIQAQSEAAIQIAIDKEAIDLVQRKTYSVFLQKMEDKLLSKMGANGNLVKRIYEQPLSVGIDTSNSLLGFIEIIDNQIHTGVQIPLADASLFETQLKKYAQNNLLNVQSIDPNIDNERIRSALEVQRAERIAKRKKRFEIQTFSESGVRFIQQDDFLLAWTSTHAFVLRSNLENTAERVENYEGSAADFYELVKQEVTQAQQNYIQELQPIIPQNLLHDISIQLSPKGATMLNEANQNLGMRAPLRLLFDQDVILESADYQITIDFEPEQIEVQLLQNGESQVLKNWTKAELIEDWSDIELVAGEDSLDVWFKVLGQRVQ